MGATSIDPTGNRRAPALPRDAATAIARAIAVRSSDLAYEELLLLGNEMSDYVTAFLPTARTLANQLWSGSLERHRITVRLDAIERQAAQNIGPGALSAHVHLRTLAHDLQWLMGWVEARDNTAANGASHRGRP